MLKKYSVVVVKHFQTTCHIKDGCQNFVKLQVKWIYWAQYLGVMNSSLDSKQYQVFIINAYQKVQYMAYVNDSLFNFR